MRDTDPELSTAEVRDLADEFGIDLRDGEIDRVRSTVADLLAGVGDLRDLPVDGATGTGPARTWHRPTSDPHDSVTVSCDVRCRDPSGPLAGTTVGVKDVIAVAGVPMECGSEVMQGFVPARDATVVDRLLAAGASVSAKTALDEFAGSARGTTGRGPPVRNPRDRERTAGGSSGGSAAAVAANRVDVALGTDTGGSVRIPAAFCGVVGLKPTYGLVPLSGVVENTYSLDHVGTLTSTAPEAAAVLEAVAGPDAADPASAAAAGRDAYAVGGYADAAATGADPESAAVGVLAEGFGSGVRDAVADRLADAVDRISDTGATVRRVSVDHYEHFRAVKNVLSATEIAAHWRADGAPLRSPGPVDPIYQTAFADRRRASDRSVNTFYKAKLLAGAYLQVEDAGRTYTYARAARRVLRDAFDEAMADLDAVVLPTTPDVAPLLPDADAPGFDYARNTRPADVTGRPAITLPHGTVDGLPVGVQLIGDEFGEADLLHLAGAVEPLLADP